MRIERVLAPCLDLIVELLAQPLLLGGQSGGLEQEHQALDGAAAAVLDERLDVPHPVRVESRGRVRILRRIGRIEHVIEPAVCLLEAPVRAQALRDHERRVEEQLPIVDRVSAIEGEIEVVARLQRRDLRQRG